MPTRCGSAALSVRERSPVPRQPAHLLHQRGLVDTVPRPQQQRVEPFRGLVSGALPPVTFAGPCRHHHGLGWRPRAAAHENEKQCAQQRNGRQRHATHNTHDEAQHDAVATHAPRERARQKLFEFAVSQVAMRRSLCVRVASADAEWLMATVRGPPPSAVHVQRALELHHATPMNHRDPLWYLPLRVALEGRYRVVAEAGRFHASPVDQDAPSDDALVDGFALVKAYKKLPAGEVDVRVGPVSAGAAVQAMENIVAMAPSWDCERRVERSARLQRPVKGGAVHLLVPAQPDQDVRERARGRVHFDGAQGRDRVMLMPGGVMPLFCTRDRLLFAVRNPDVQAVRLEPPEVVAFAQRHSCHAFMLATSWRGPNLKIEKFVSRSPPPPALASAHRRLSPVSICFANSSACSRRETERPTATRRPAVSRI